VEKGEKMGRGPIEGTYNSTELRPFPTQPQRNISPGHAPEVKENGKEMPGKARKPKKSAFKISEKVNSKEN